MLAKLLSLLLHAKAGAISGVFLLGATGALVSVSASNGVTTIVLTDPSPTPTATATPRPTEKPEATPTAKPAAPQLSSLTSPACIDEAKTIALQVQRVDGAFSTFHTDLMKLRDVRARATIKTADKLLKQVREAAVKAIHATASATCKEHDDDEDATDNDKDEDATDVDKDKDKDKDEAPSPGLTFTGDATSIADQAIAAMQTAFDAAKNAPAATPKPTHSPEQKKTNDSKKHEGKDSGHHD